VWPAPPSPLTHKRSRPGSGQLTGLQPEHICERIASDAWESLISHPFRPLENKAIQGNTSGVHVQNRHRPGWLGREGHR